MMSTMMWWLQVWMVFGVAVEWWVVVDNTGPLVPLISCFEEGNELPWWQQIGRTTW